MPKKEFQDLRLHENWQITFGSVKDAVSVIDLSGKIIKCNKATRAY